MLRHYMSVSTFMKIAASRLLCELHYLFCDHPIGNESLNTITLILSRRVILLKFRKNLEKISNNENILNFILKKYQNERKFDISRKKFSRNFVENIE